MQKLHSAKIIFCLAALLFVAKPFLGFSMFSRKHPPAVENIFVKAFTKRKLEDSENSKFNLSAIQKLLVDSSQQFILRFSFLLSILFPAIFALRSNITNRFLNELQLSLVPREHAYLFNGKLLI
jgi:hypothetical protein